MGFASLKQQADGELAVMESSARSLIKAGRGTMIEQLVQQGGNGGQPLSNAWEQSRKTGQQKKLYGEMRLWAWAAINVISKRVSAQSWCAGHYEPVEAEKQTPDKRSAKRLALLDGIPQAIRRSKRSKAYTESDVEPDESHPSIWTLEEPNSIQGKSEFVYFTAANMLVTGEFYWLGGIVKQGRGKGERMVIYAVPSSWIEPDHKDGPFSGFWLKTGDGTRGIPLPKENVARGYFPDPSDPKACMSPLMACLQANKIDGYILQSQQDNFEYGLDPKLLITIGDNPLGNGQGGMRPRLSSAQQRQIRRAITSLWRQSQQDRVAILDGLIGDVKKLQMTPQEMDWKQSGETVKARVLQTFGVNGYVLGDQVLGSYAQANIAELNFANNVANPIIESISCTATKFLSQFYEDGDTLAVWLEAYHPRDEDREDRRWQFMRTNGDVTQDEIRARNGLGPGEPVEERSPLMNNPQTLAQIVAMAAQVSAGGMTHDNAVQVLATTLQISKADAKKMMPDDPPEPEPGHMLPGQAVQPTPPTAAEQQAQREEQQLAMQQAAQDKEDAEKGWQDQPRDDIGRWGEGTGGSAPDRGDGSGAGGTSPSEPAKPSGKPKPEQPSGANLGTHVKKLTGDKVAGQKLIDGIAHIDKSFGGDVTKFLEKNPLKELRVSADAKVAPGIKSSDGLYQPFQQRIVMRPEEKLGDPTMYEPGSAIAIDIGQATDSRASQASVTFTHELGHHIALTVEKADKTNSFRRDVLLKAFNEDDKKVSTYAGTHFHEYFAESFAAYHHAPDRLSTTAKGMVEEVMRRAKEL